MKKLLLLEASILGGELAFDENGDRAARSSTSSRTRAASTRSSPIEPRR